MSTDQVLRMVLLTSQRTLPHSLSFRVPNFGRHQASLTAFNDPTCAHRHFAAALLRVYPFIAHSFRNDILLSLYTNKSACKAPSAGPMTPPALATSLRSRFGRAYCRPTDHTYMYKRGSVAVSVTE